MSTTTTSSTRLATLPRVNLLPPEIQQRKQAQRIQAGLILMVVAAIGGVGFVYVNGGSAVSDAKTRLQAGQAQQTELQRTVARLQNAATVANTRDSAEASLTEAMATEVHFSEYMADLGQIIPSQTWFTNVSFGVTVPVGSLASPNDAPAAVGSVSFTGTVVSRKDLANWLDTAAKEPGFVDPYFTTSQERYIGTTKVADFASSVTLSSDALTKRCAQPGAC